MSYDINEIKQQFDRVISYSQGIDSPKTKELFQRFLKAKKEIIDWFGGELIYEIGPVSFDLDEKTKDYTLETFIENVSYTYNNMPLASFISSNKEGFFNNTVINEFSLSDGKKIPKGMKLVKAFKYFEEDKHLLEDIQNYASRIIQEDKITGTLCFSVHPFYLDIQRWRTNRCCHI